MVEIQPYLRRVVERASAPTVRASLTGFSRSLLFVFTDTHETWLIRIVDGQASAPARETPQRPDVTITTSTDVLAGVMDGKIDPLAATVQHRIQIKGAMDDLLRLQTLLVS